MVLGNVFAFLRWRGIKAIPEIKKSYIKTLLFMVLSFFGQTWTFSQMLPAHMKQIHAFLIWGRYDAKTTLECKECKTDARQFCKKYSSVKVSS